MIPALAQQPLITRSPAMGGVGHWLVAFVVGISLLAMSSIAVIAAPPTNPGEPSEDAEPVETARPEPGPQRTGLPLPRFASLTSNKVNVRRGPGKIYPVDWVFVRKGMPVEITAEWELWRKIRDSDGTTGWVHKSMLGGTRTAMILGDVRALYRRPDPASGALARAEAGVIGKVLSCHGEWCRLDLGAARGWLPRTEFWGVYPNEELD
jgi:SH3-like domain-containing protein